VKGKNLNQPGVFPLKLQDAELGWKLFLNYDVEGDFFILFINEEAFLGLPFQAELAPSGPQNIEKGTIMLNQVKIHEKFAQYYASIFDDWLADRNL